MYLVFKGASRACSHSVFPSAKLCRLTAGYHICILLFIDQAHDMMAYSSKQMSSHSIATVVTIITPIEIILATEEDYDIREKLLTTDMPRFPSTKQVEVL